MNKLKALVLCGGMSSRMGRDKGLLLHAGKTWAEIATKKAEALGLEVFISVNRAQEHSYSTLFPPDMLLPDDFSGIYGPLRGILSAHKQFRSTDWLVIPCDMLFLSPEKLRELSETYRNYPGNNVYIFGTDRDQPFPGIYTSEVLTWTYNFFLIGKFTSCRMKDVLDFKPVLKIRQDEADISDFLNLNSPEDLEKAG